MNIYDVSLGDFIDLVTRQIPEAKSKIAAALGLAEAGKVVTLPAGDSVSNKIEAIKALREYRRNGFLGEDGLKECKNAIEQGGVCIAKESQIYKDLAAAGIRFNG